MFNLRNVFCTVKTILVTKFDVSVTKILMTFSPPTFNIDNLNYSLISISLWNRHQQQVPNITTPLPSPIKFTCTFPLCCSKTFDIKIKIFPAEVQQLNPFDQNYFITYRFHSCFSTDGRWKAICRSIFCWLFPIPILLDLLNCEKMNIKLL